jgi:hypothetical protein
MANTMPERLCRLVLLSVLLVAGVVGASQDANANGSSREPSANANAGRTHEWFPNQAVRSRPLCYEGS